MPFMPKRFLTQNTLYCFSPPVMLATMLIEFGGAIYAFWRYRLNKAGRLIVVGLLALGMFQLAEYFICEDLFGIHGLSWARVGFVSITLLPPLGVSLSMALAKKKNPHAEVLMWLACAAFVIYYGFFSGALTSETCQGNYVIFTGDKQAGPLYGLYYFSLLAVGTYFCFSWAKKTSDKKQAKALRSFAIGYLVFIVPTIVVALINPAARAAIPSVMCGFAVMLSFALIFGVLPNAGMQKRTNLSKTDEDKSQEISFQ